MKRQSTDPKRFGANYWHVKVSRTVDPSGWLYVYGDTVEVMASGELKIGARFQTIAVERPNTVIARGRWLALYAANPKTQQPVALVKKPA